MPGHSIIIAYHNEGQAFINETVKQIRETADLNDYEIIIVDDHSDRKIAMPGAKIVRHAQNHGVGRAFDTGAYYAQGDNLILMGSDIRFIANNWMSKLVTATEANPKSLICTSCVALNDSKPRGMDIEYRRNINMRSGASLLAIYNAAKKPSPARIMSILAAQWLPLDRKQTGIVEVPVILGAIYGVTKEWYRYIDGFAGHKVWGTLEPLISIKSYMFGGDCLCHKDVETGHIFRVKSTHGVTQENVYYNKLWAAMILFDNPLRDRLISALPNNRHVEAAKKLIDKQRATNKHNEYKVKAVMNGDKTLARMNASYKK